MKGLPCRLRRDGTRMKGGFRAASGEAARGGFCFGGRALLRFILRAVAGACVGRRTGQARMPPVDRQHEGLRFLRQREGAGKDCAAP